MRLRVLRPSRANVSGESVIEDAQEAEAVGV